MPKCDDCEKKDEEYLDCLDKEGPPPEADTSHCTMGSHCVYHDAQGFCVSLDQEEIDRCIREEQEEAKREHERKCDEKGEDADDCWSKCHEGPWV